MADYILNIRHIVKKYKEHVVLDDLSLEVEEGGVIVIIGPSGCGKSTLLRCINGLEKIQSGSISTNIQGYTGNIMDMGVSRQKIGMVFQSYDLFPHMDVLGNIMLAPVKVQKREKDKVKKEALALLERVGLENKAKSYPRQLSGGQKPYALTYL